uniref:Amyloid-beta A4 precursor protein-binding family A member 3 n=1 Tax=Monopterus albus TaxID=43700 RepID=A0A3Q3IYJ4_MONAL
MRYYKQYCPEGGYIKQAVGGNVNENNSAVDQFTSRSRHTTEICKGSQSETKPHKAGHRFRSPCAPLTGDEAEGDMEKGQENRFCFSDGDEIEVVLDGAKFIEDLEETESSVQRPVSLYQGNETERVRKGSDERERDGSQVTRNHNVQGAGKKCESSHMGSKEKERQGKGRGRMGTGEGTEHMVSQIKASTTNTTEQHPKTLSKDYKKAAVRTKTRSGSRKQQPPPLPRHSCARSPADTQKGQPHREPPPIPRPSPSPANTSLVFVFCCIVPGPCEPEDLIDGIIFAANYLGCTQVLSDKNPSKSVRMSQAHEAVSQIKSQDEDSQMMTEVDLFISTKAVKVLNADTQETMMNSALRTISYIADIGSIVVLMARRQMSQASSEDFSESSDSTSEGKSQYGMICYVFESEDAQLIAQSIGQAFSVAYREFLRANGINPTDLSQKQYSDIINSQEMYHDDLVHFSNSDNCKEVRHFYLAKQKGEILGVVIVESGWGSILPTVILASMLNSGPAARSGKLSVGDQIMSINDTSLVGLPLATCQGIIKGLKNQVKVKLSIVSCPPVTTVLIKRPDLKFQLGFSVQNGIICSLMRGGIAERGGVRVGHRIIEINGQSVVAMAHEKIVQTLSVSVGEINMKTMPAVMFRLLTGQETPIYI